MNAPAPLPPRPSVVNYLSFVATGLGFLSGGIPGLWPSVVQFYIESGITVAIAAGLSAWIATGGNPRLPALLCLAPVFCCTSLVGGFDPGVYFGWNAAFLIAWGLALGGWLGGILPRLIRGWAGLGAGRRAWSVVTPVLLLGILLLCVFRVPLHVLFRAHRPWLEGARNGRILEVQHVGLYRVVRSQRGFEVISEGVNGVPAGNSGAFYETYCGFARSLPGQPVTSSRERTPNRLSIVTDLGDGWYAYEEFQPGDVPGPLPGP